jgi:hypothetical protein
MPILDDVSFESFLGSCTETETANLATAREELASLRYMVILTARWESSDSLHAKRRAQLRSDLAQLRTSYSQKIDQIAMTFGIQQAMEAKEHVEHRITVPRGAKLPGVVRVEDDYDL